MAVLALLSPDQSLPPQPEEGKKQKAWTLTLSQHYKALKSAELLGTLLNAYCMQESKLFLVPVFAPN